MGEEQDAHPEVAVIGVYGPDGRRVDAGQQLPGSWPREYVESLVADGAAAAAGGKWVVDAAARVERKRDGVA